MILKAYKYRIYPDDKQTDQINRTFGCCRFVYNTMLAYRKSMYEEQHISVSRIDCNNYCNRVMKDQYPWLREVDKFALTNAIYNMDSAYQKFFKEHAGYPRFKRKHDSRKSYTTNMSNKNIEINFEEDWIKLPYLKRVKARLHRSFTGKVKRATVSRTPTGKFFVSILVETEQEKLPHIDKAVGIDVGIKGLCITSDGKVYENPKAYIRYQEKLVRLQRQLAHKEKGSANYNKTKRKIALCHEKIANIRRDCLHKVSSELVSENQVIVTEDLRVKNMLGNHNLSKHIADASWGELFRQLEYKSAWNGRQYIQVSTFFASSQMCGNCGYQNRDVKNLSIRKWTCPVCGTYHDRDVNAARNILREGLSQAA